MCRYNYLHLISSVFSVSTKIQIFATEGLKDEVRVQEIVNTLNKIKFEKNSINKLGKQDHVKNLLKDFCQDFLSIFQIFMS